MKRYKLILFFNIFILLTASAQKIENLVELKQQSENRLFHRLDKAPRTPAFASEGYWVWGSSIVKGDDGKYHMFVSRFPKKYRTSRTRCTVLGRAFYTQSAHIETKR